MTQWIGVAKKILKEGGDEIVLRKIIVHQLAHPIQREILHGDRI
jgi:hypothetical protein